MLGEQAPGEAAALQPWAVAATVMTPEGPRDLGSGRDPTQQENSARERRLVALVVATDLLVWKLLRREMGLGRATAERIVIEMITATKGAP